MVTNLTFYAAFTVFGGLLVILGTRYYRSASSLEAYWLAGRRLSQCDEVVTTVATFSGSINFIALVGAVYVLGLSGAWLGFSLAFGVLLWGVLAARRVRERRIRTVPELFSECSATARKTVSFFFLVRNVMLIIVELMGAGLVLGVLLNVPFSVGVLLSAVLVTLYTSLGGLWPVVKSDYLQLALTLLAFAALTTAALKLGSLSLVPASRLNPLNMDPVALLGILLTCIPLAWTVSPLYDRASAATSTRATRGIWIGGAILVLLIAPSVLIGLATSTAPLVIPDPEVAALFLPGAVFPAAVTGLIAVCILSAITSTADSFIMSAAAIAVNDLIPQRIALSDRAKLLATRLSVVGISVVSASVAVSASSVMTTFLVLMKVVVSTLFVPTVAALYRSSRLSSRSVVGACWGGFLAAILWTLLGTPFRVDPVIPGVFCSTLGFVIGSLVEKPVEPVQESS